MEEAEKKSAFVDHWQDVAMKHEGYISKPIYSAILAALVQCENESEIHLNGNQPLLKQHRLQDEDIEIVLKSLLLVPDVVKLLDISYNQLTDAGLENICEHIIKTHFNLLRDLNLSYCDFTESGIQTLAEALNLNETIFKLSLDGNDVNRDGGMALAAMLQVNTKLKHLSISSTNLNTDVIIAFSTVLHRNKTLEYLDVSRPLLHSKLEESTVHVGEMLKINKSLKHLGLSKHGITDTGIDWITHGLKFNTVLSHLDISCNKISRDGAALIAKVLATNSTLKFIDLSFNRIENEGLISISEVLRKSNKTLESLLVCNNSIHDEGLCNIADVLLSDNTTLKTLYIWGNKWGTPTCDAFKKLLDSERLGAADTDVTCYVVDGIACLARTIQHSL